MPSYYYRNVLPDSYFEGQPLSLTHTPQPVASDAVAEDVYRLTREVQTPVRYGDGKLLSPDAPWETFFQCPAVLYDPEDRLYKMWYSTRHFNPDYEPDWETNTEAGNANKMICYLESKDGIHWVRPELDIVPFGPWKKNNIVFADSDVGAAVGTVIFNPDKSDPARRFLMVWADGYGVYLSASPDGKHWHGTYQITNVPMDCTLSFAYNETSGVWQLFCRPAIFPKAERQPAEKAVCPNLNYRRRIALMESADLKTWSTPRTVFAPDETIAASQADNITFFTVGDHPMAFMHLFEVHNMYQCLNQFMLPYLAFGTDAAHWELTEDPHPAIGRGAVGAWDENSINIHGIPMDLGDDRVYYYYCGEDRTHHAALGLLSFGKDRYCARVGDEFGGWMLSREFLFNGSGLEINAEILPHGSIEVEILDGEHGTVRGCRRIDGFALDDCDKITESGYHLPVSWKGNEDLSALNGRAVYLRFHLTSAKLYTFTVKE